MPHQVSLELALNGVDGSPSDIDYTFFPQPSCHALSVTAGPAAGGTVVGSPMRVPPMAYPTLTYARPSDGIPQAPLRLSSSHPAPASSTFIRSSHIHPRPPLLAPPPLSPLSQVTLIGAGFDAFGAIPHATAWTAAGGSSASHRLVSRCRRDCS